jgi:hypothetical protein
MFDKKPVIEPQTQSTSTFSHNTKIWEHFLIEDKVSAMEGPEGLGMSVMAAVWTGIKTVTTL